MDAKKTFLQVLKFALVSCLVGIVQLVLVNVLFYVLRGWKAPLPGFLAALFSAGTVGAGNDNWGYVLPFFLSNLIANIYGYFQNQKTTFQAKDTPVRSIRIYIAVIVLLILFSTWLQGVVANRLLASEVALFVNLAPTLAAAVAGTMQFLILFPLEKYVLFKE